MVQRFLFQSNDGTEISAAKWTPEGEVKALVQIVHGMNEHIGRHTELAEFLCSNGFAVYGQDLRGHGLTAKKGSMGHFADKNGIEKLMEDINALMEIMKKDYPGKKLFVFGHSMGSFILRNYVFTCGNKINGLLLSGTGGLPFYKKVINTILLKTLRIFVKPDKRMLFLHNIGTSDLNKSFKPRRTDYDWLSTNPETADKYLADPLCGTIDTFAFYDDLITMMIKMEQPENIVKIPKDLPIFIFSGSMDPVGLNGKKVTQTYEDYKKAGITDVSIKVYDGLRHELHNEPVRDELFQKILQWIEKKL